jgi:hypothetical protein
VRENYNRKLIYNVGKNLYEPTASKMTLGEKPDFKIRERENHVT